MSKYYDPDDDEGYDIIEPIYNPADYKLRIEDLKTSHDKQLPIKLTKYDNEELIVIVHAFTDSEVRYKLENPAIIELETIPISEIRKTSIEYRKDLNDSKTVESPFEKPLD